MMLVVVSYVHRDMETAMSGKDQGVGPLWDACEVPVLFLLSLSI